MDGLGDVSKVTIGRFERVSKRLAVVHATGHNQRVSFDPVSRSGGHNAGTGRSRGAAPPFVARGCHRRRRAPERWRNWLCATRRSTPRFSESVCPRTSLEARGPPAAQGSRCVGERVNVGRLRSLHWVLALSNRFSSSKGSELLLPHGEANDWPVLAGDQTSLNRVGLAAVPGEAADRRRQPPSATHLRVEVPDLVTGLFD